MHNSKIKRISLAVCLALMPFAADAAGLGKMTVMSGLGEPLAAEIDISGGKEELSALTARIAPSETYAEQGVERASSLGAIRVELAKKADGSSVLKLSTSQPVNDPFLDMLIQVDWPTGRLLREYTALLDPPGYGDRTNAASVGGEQLPAVAAPSKKNTSKRAAQPGSPSAPVVGSKENPSNTGTYKTRRGDTLRNVARNTQVDDVTLEQMLVGLFRANREAFIGDNMNQLKVGQIMHVPPKDELQAVSQQEALQEVRVHTANWNAYRSKLADTVAKTNMAQQDSTQQQVSSGKITAATEDMAAPPPASGPRDVVKLSKSETEAGKTGAAVKNGNDTEKLKALEEESTSQDKAIEEVNERIAFFEKQIQDMQKLLLVQNQILADLQKGKPVAPSAAPAPDATPQPDTQAKSPATQVKPTKPAPLPPPSAAPEASLLDTLMEDPALLGGAGGVLVLLAGGWLYLRSKRRKSLDAFEKGILTSGGLKSDTVFGATGSAAVDTGETSFLSDFSQRTGAGMIDTSDVDPMSEAEVYMAYGRDAQAEEILKDAIVKEPKRYELHHKLLEIYANRKDVSAFETLAGELYATLGVSDPNWQKVADIGRTVEPDNPMYAGAHEAGAAVAASQQSESGSEPAMAMTTESVAAEEEIPVSQDNSLDFDLGMLAAEEPTETPVLEKEAEQGEAEALPDLEAFETPAAEEDLAAEPAAEQAPMDFSFELPEPAAENNVQLDATELGLDETVEAEAPSFDLPGLEIVEAPAESAPEQEAVQEEVADLGVPALAVPETSGGNVEEISFDLPELAMPEDAPATEEITFEMPDIASETSVPGIENTQAAKDETPADLALPDFELPEIGSSEAVAEAERPMQTDFDLPEDMKEIQVAESAEAVASVPEAPKTDAGMEEIVLEETPVENSKLDFDFDAGIDAEASQMEVAQEPAAPVPDLDLSGISLEVGDAAPAAEEITLSGAESSDVDTKLDLVTAYMDMGDTEGARELLEEVLQEGGPQQRERAQKLLDSLA